MKFERPLPFKKICPPGAVIWGDAQRLVEGLCTMYDARAGHVGFAETQLSLYSLVSTDISAIFTKREIFRSLNNTKIDQAVCFTENPSAAFDHLLRQYGPIHERVGGDVPFPTREEFRRKKSWVATDAFIENQVEIGSGCLIYPGVYIARRVEIGNEVVLCPNVTVYNDVKIGNRVLIEANSVIGGLPNWYYRDAGAFRDFFARGSVEIRDDVSIGAQTIVDRGLCNTTIIEAGSRIGNLVQIGHGCSIGEGCLIVAQSGAAGEVTLGPGVEIAAQSGVNRGVEVAAGVKIMAKSGVSANIRQEGMSVFGIPAVPLEDYNLREAASKQLPRIITNAVFRTEGGLLDRFLAVISDQLGQVKVADMTAGSILADAGVDSLDIAEMSIEFEAEFGLSELERNLHTEATVGEIYLDILRKTDLSENSSLEGRIKDHFLEVLSRVLPKNANSGDAPIAGNGATGTFVKYELAARLEQAFNVRFSRNDIDSFKTIKTAYETLLRRKMRRRPS